MVRSFARFKAEELPTTTEEKEKRKISTYAFAPISDKVFRDTIASDITTSEPVSGVQTPLQQEPTEEEEIDALNVASTPTLGELGRSREPAAPTNAPVDGLVVDAHREMRIKIYMGQLFLCWAWIVPLFHMKPPSSPSTSSSTTSNSDTTSSNITNINGGLPLAYHPSTAQTGKAKLVLSMEGGAKELDFALGIGADILDLEIDMEWVVPTGGGLGGVGNVDGDAGNAPGAVSGEVQGRTGSADTEAGQGGVAKTIQAIAQGGVTDPRAVVNAKQAVEGV
ncbi:hypothetical protein BDV98DRAFT_205878 [Pterulicium gracile]|uniref:Uncharacterized protein n=1 Tax=Pterulicium gracile TaxID=1884261 RepID=A0A5C3Q8W7_9AGAR|nr:hypothetical protein BDV98DRAFT_205878 [Pterula gracilis]